MQDDTVTHFIPWDTHHNGREARALCGRMVRRRVHATDPACGDCAIRRAAELADTRTGADVFGRPGE
jgi:hypothetical protein